MFLLVVDGEIEEDKLQGLDPVEIEPFKTFLRVATTQSADEFVEPIPVKQGLFGKFDALLMKPLIALLTLDHLLVPESRLAAIAVPALLIFEVIVIPLE